MLFPTSFFHFFARKQYALILDKTLWTIDYPEKSGFRITIDSNHYALRQGPTLDELEEDFFDDKKDCIEKSIEGIARANAATPALADLQSAGLARFVMEEIIPSYNPNAADNQQGTTYQERRSLQERPGLPKKVKERRGRPQRMDGVLQRMFPEACYFSEGEFYSLRRKTHPQDLKLIHFKGSDLTIGDGIGSLADIEQRYQNKLEETLYQRACREVGSLAQRMRDIHAKPSLVRAVTQGHLYDPVSTLGFTIHTIHNRRFYLTQTVEPYVLETNDGGATAYFEFPKATIGIELRDTSEGIYWCAPVVIERYVHPCLRGDAPMQQMCLGAFSLSSLRQQGSVNRQILRLLYESRKKLISGYYGHGGPHNHLSDKRYAGHKRRLSELRANITNEACSQ